MGCALGHSTDALQDYLRQVADAVPRWDHMEQAFIFGPSPENPEVPFDEESQVRRPGGGGGGDIVVIVFFSRGEGDGGNGRSGRVILLFDVCFVEEYLFLSAVRFPFLAKLVPVFFLLSGEVIGRQPLGSFEFTPTTKKANPNYDMAAPRLARLLLAVKP